MQSETPDCRSYTGKSNNILPWLGEAEGNPDSRSFTGVSKIIFLYFYHDSPIIGHMMKSFLK